MNTEQKRWVKRLERCFKDMPDGIEVMAKTSYSSTCDMLILPEGSVDEIEASPTADRWAMSDLYHQASLTEFSANGIIANSESI